MCWGGSGGDPRWVKPAKKISQTARGAVPTEPDSDQSGSVDSEQRFSAQRMGDEHTTRKPIKRLR